MKKSPALIMFVCLFTLCTMMRSAHAEEEDMYTGIGLSYAIQKLDSPLSTGNHNTQGQVGAKLYTGNLINENLALEAGYHYLHQKEIKAHFINAKTGMSDTLNVQGHLFSLTANGILPLNPRFSVIAKLGGALYYGKTDYSHNMTGVTQTAHITKTTGTPVFGIGAEYKIDKDLSVRAEYENFGKPHVTDTHKMQRIEMFSIGLHSFFD